MSFINIEDAFNKLNRTQIFLLAIILIAAGTFMSIYKSDKVIDVTNELMVENKRVLNNILGEMSQMNTNVIIMLNDNLNILSEDVATDYIELSVRNFGYNAVEETMKTLSYNHIYDENRKAVINDYITKDFINYYVKKRNLLNKVYYNGVPLVVVWDSFNIHEFIKKVLDKMFSEEYTMDYNHEKLRKDLYDLIIREISSQCEEFVSIIHKINNQNLNIQKTITDGKANGTSYKERPNS